MAIDQSKVYIGAPDQSTTGAVSTADVGVECPASARALLDPDVWSDGGYVSDAGVTLSQSRSTSGIKDWGLNTVRTIASDFTGTVSFTEMQTDYETACRWAGSENVERTGATGEHGEQLKIAIGPKLPPARAWCFSMKDEGRRMRIFIPRGRVTAVADATFASTANVGWQLTITCENDESGNAIYLLTDDGQVVGSTGIKAPTSIAITTPPSKTEYAEGETFSPDGMVVTATYDDGTTLEVSGYSISPTSALVESVTQVMVSYTQGGVTKTATQPISVTASE